jgi:hypothetical protein
MHEDDFHSAFEEVALILIYNAMTRVDNAGEKSAASENATRA